MNRVGIAGLVRRLAPPRLGRILLTVVPVAAAAGAGFLVLDGNWQVVPLFAGATILVGLAFWKVPQWQAETAMRRKPTRNHFETENAARATLAQALSGVFLVIGLAVTWRELSDTQRLTQEGQITERFTRAVDQLGSEKLQVQLGGFMPLSELPEILRPTPVPCWRC